MGGYIPGTEAEQKEMLREIGLERMEDLFAGVPEDVKQKAPLDLPPGMPEMAVRRRMEDLARQNRVFRTLFRGAGAYRHYIPAIVNQIAGREEFTAVYTPYQPEINQGILQALFEYQTMICELTGLDVSNNSMYDGASAAAEALLMCLERHKRALFVSETVDPKVLAVMETYCGGRGIRLQRIPARDGATDWAALEAQLAAAEEPPAGVYFQSPNYYGIIEDAATGCRLAHEAGALAVMGVNPLSLGVLKTPGEYGADIAVGEGQPLGIPLAYGGPYLGFLTARQALLRRMPGKIVGETVDDQGRRAFALTLQAREQHIRREKAGSNICTNQAHCAVRAGLYLAAVGPAGLRETAQQCTAKAHYLCRRLEAAGLARKYRAEFFHEFVTVCEPAEADGILAALEEQGVLGGLPLGEGEILWCATECNTKEEIDFAAEVVRRVLDGAAV